MFARLADTSRNLLVERDFWPTPAQRSLAIVPAVVAVLLVNLAVGEAREAAWLDVPCLGSMSAAITAAIAGFACAFAAVRMALAGAWIVIDLSARPTPALRRWALVSSALALLCWTPVAAAAFRSYDDPRPVALRGFAGGSAEFPQTGAWTATGTYRFSEGLGSRGVGDKITRTLGIDRVCAEGGCTLTLTRSYATGVHLTAPLVQRADGWHALLPAQRFACSVGSSDSAPMRSQWVLRFSGGGRIVEARERVFVYQRGCQYRNSLVEWFAERPAPPRDARPGDPGDRV